MLLSTSSNLICASNLQFYCDSSNKSICQPQPSAIAISNVSFSNVTGTSNGSRGIVFNCSDTVPCLDIRLSGIDIVPSGSKPLVSLYRNAYGSKTNLVSPVTDGVTFMPLPIPADQQQAFNAQVAKCR